MMELIDNKLSILANNDQFGFIYLLKKNKYMEIE